MRRVRINRAKTLWLLRTFGECQVMAQVIVRRGLVSPLIHKDFRVCPLSSRVEILLQLP